MKLAEVSAQAFSVSGAKKRCLTFRRRILTLSQGSPPLHIAPAFSCLEIVDTIYFGLMRNLDNAALRDTFILSKGHGALAQYAVLEELGILPSGELDRFGRPSGKLGAHPDLGVPGVDVSTGSLGHALAIAIGMALADKNKKIDRAVYVVLSDGELQEGSNWEAMMLAPTFVLNHLVAIVDLNDHLSSARISQTHPNFYPLKEKIEAFGWEVVEADGHDHADILNAVASRKGDKPLAVLAYTTKGKGVSFMENVPIWHYRSPSPAEYTLAMAELDEAEKKL